MAIAQLKLSAFASGIVVPIEAVPDPVFAGRMLGDGLAIDPSEGVLYAPCDGVIAQLHRSHHACVLESAEGVRMLLHIGIDTVLLKGEGFAPRVAEGEAVRAGQPLIEFDVEILKRHGKPVLTMLVIENGDAFRIASRSARRSIWTGDELMSVVAANAPVAPADGTPGESAKTEAETANGWATVRHAGGLHARPCALLANAVKKFDAAVEVRVRGKAANARSATAVMGLAIGEGEEIEISASGPNAGDALEAAIIALQTPSTAVHAAPADEPDAVSRVALLPGQLAGVVASPGMVIGVTARLDHAVSAIREQGEGETLERRALAATLHAVVGDIESAIAEAERRGFVEQAEIFTAHRVLVDDPEMFAYASGLIAAGKSAAFAWRGATEAHCATLLATGNALLAGRVADLRDIERQVLRKLAGDAASEPDLPLHAVVLADDLVPSDFTALVRAETAAIVTARGGATSHIAILARAQGIPTLVAVGLPLAEVRVGIEVIVDAERGVLDVAPTAERIAVAQAVIARQSSARAEVLALAHEKAETTDGVRIEVAANIATAADAAEAVKLGAESVGLLRTELLFLDRAKAPSETEQRAAYQAVVDALDGKHAIIRTLDVGADKSLPYIPMPEEENPALGLRGIRLCLARQALLAEQLRAILAVRPLASVKIMLPMVTDTAEIVATRAVLDRLAREMGIAERVELGVMIETPSAAILADQLAQVADFFSVGTNDLTQYALCMDRTNPALAARVDGLHPAVLRLLAQAAQGAADHGKWLGVCGAMASDPMAVPLLIGLGVTELSVSPAVIPEIKAVVRRLNLAECRSAALAALQLASADAVRAHVKKTWLWLDAAQA
ncbi:MAG: phosphoenolpyruvate--protein phosphotransferase [Propionivibrio sp.]